MQYRSDSAVFVERFAPENEEDFKPGTLLRAEFNLDADTMLGGIDEASVQTNVPGDTLMLVVTTVKYRVESSPDVEEEEDAPRCLSSRLYRDTQVMTPTGLLWIVSDTLNRFAIEVQ